MANIVCPKCGKNNCRKSDILKKISGIAGAGVGGVIGSSIGIAALGTGIAATLPLAIIAGSMSYMYINNRFVCQDCGKSFTVDE